jgi:hypothetical protein
MCDFAGLAGSGMAQRDCSAHCEDRMWVVEDVPEQIYRFAMRPRMIAKRPLDRAQCKRKKRIAAAV